ncbi:MAG: hypothetical protein H6937_11825 [Burkholderiales bacterium]|nr:hypothetical protein [Burkholderiales bacterium]
MHRLQPARFHRPDDVITQHQVPNITQRYQNTLVSGQSQKLTDIEKHFNFPCSPPMACASPRWLP